MTVTWLVHRKHSPGKALCLAAEPTDAFSITALPGELLTLDRSEITCPTCIEWMHA